MVEEIALSAMPTTSIIAYVPYQALDSCAIGFYLVDLLLPDSQETSRGNDMKKTGRSV